ncbi:GNAT family N-acetyltransferase [Sphingobium algorifonticola]|uniref:N-acetyltransferase n=1 Tax=Sphingobium algorifonticola TaxID=2008318 RepID=A0A437J903_9SPHN|nr:N-acetyltransferase [Sphingobium algorifonticola]RVT41974.1 N-acetyltransferase [Sphingobium algorifonticola]
MTRIIPLDSQSGDAIDALLDAAFGADRRGRTAYAIRAGMPWLPLLSYAAVDDGGALVGTLQSWPVALHDADGVAHPLVMVGPVAVRPDQQGGGVGRALMDRVVHDARSADTAPLMMIGDPDYYGRFWGFSADGTAGWDAPGPFDPRRLLALPHNNAPLPPVGLLGPRLTQDA